MEGRFLSVILTPTVKKPAVAAKTPAQNSEKPTTSPNGPEQAPVAEATPEPQPEPATTGSANES